MQPEGHEVSHLEIYRLLIEVKTTLDLTLKRNDEDRQQDEKEKADIFGRIGKLENRMAQVMIIAVTLSVLIPVSVELFGNALVTSGERIERSR
jgi:hypothetical protein